MQGSSWTCQFPGCSSSPDQIAILRTRRPDGFPHDEDPQLRVCTVCRRLPLKGKPGEEPIEKLDAAFLAGIKEELAAIEENEKNIQALSQVFRYYAKHAKQLSEVLFDFAVKQCFPWELIHALHLVDDILLMDNTGRYKEVFRDRVQSVMVHAFKKVGAQEKREVARMLHTWQELKIFDVSVLDAIRCTIRSCDARASAILDDAAVAEEDEDTVPPPPPPFPTTVPTTKRRRRENVAETVNDGQPGPPRETVSATKATAPAADGVANNQAPAQRVQHIIDRILSIPVEQPFELLGIPASGATGHDIRKAYRRIALLIHPDKNPGLEVLCQEALVKLQNGRANAESDLQQEGNGETQRGTETRSAATAAAANASMDASCKCKYPDCDLPRCKQCANGCCTRNITHCHMVARMKNGMQCFFHPPPRAWARNA